MLNPRRKALKAIALTFVLAAVTVACGDDDDGTAADTAGDTSADTAAPADTSAATSGTTGGTTAGTEGAGAATTTAGESEGEPVKGGRIVIGIPDEATLGFDPSTTAVGAGGATEALAMYDTLAAYGAD